MWIPLTIVLSACLSGSTTARDLPPEWLTLGGRPSDVAWNAQWIWDQGPASPRNYYLCARRDFDTENAGGQLRLHISADSRYRLYLNGQWLGDGPARSFFWTQQFDTYDVTGLLKTGRNTVAVLVSHYGEGTFQYNPSGQAGLLLQLDRRGDTNWQPILVTDDKWRVQQHLGYLRPTMRISCQMPFEEIVNNRWRFRLPAGVTAKVKVAKAAFAPGKDVPATGPRKRIAVRIL